ncbi:N-acetylgalactosamine kinase-like [Oppia nitens]|uniref:N-acetylgalactosamine kinase-like n=1 Tax=Oppia nitens TaxID=1686743 RepID=UPI0023D9CF02|nr:N-acetylgalactosamine kinase-like [Oppia nitens]XP_054157905.1 N-acetylgalactosamine kinase-like [Oppia nitens]XP_054157906.1 N-acetylgalactosamine kinase-like [Oppia nitens]
MPYLLTPENVPVVIIPDELRHSERVERLIKRYNDKFESKPMFLVRVPGRVNIIGEHIDYVGYSVFPMALKQDIIMAVSVNNTPNIELTNLEANEYGDITLDPTNLEFVQPPQWYHYFQCGYRGVVDRFCNGQPPLGLNVAVHGTIPPGSGLSSSSAMVCASAFATIMAFHQKTNLLSVPINKLEITQLCIKSERYIGTDSGGMDQAIAILAQEGSAKYIEFIPELTAVNVQLPTGVNFYISHCGVSMNKAATAYYNTRVAETRLAAAVIAKKLNISGYRLGDQLWVVQQASAIPLSQMGDKLKEIFDMNKESYSKSDLVTILGIDEEELDRVFLSRVSEPIDSFKLYQRALHVYEEAARVHEYRKECETSADTHRLGQLMNESHRSCRDLYECSHPALDKLVTHALSYGAIGSRLTGAGWGGCIVSLVPVEKSTEFESMMSKHSKFNCKSGPSSGAVIYKLF